MNLRRFIPFAILPIAIGVLIIGVAGYFNFHDQKYKVVARSSVFFMGPITITVIDPLTQKPIPNLEVDYHYDIELPPIKGAMTSPPHKTFTTKYSTDINGKVTIPQTTVTPDFYEADIVVNPNYAPHNSNSDFGQFVFHLRTLQYYYETNFPNSTVLHVTMSPQDVTIELVPHLSSSAGCQVIATKNIRQCCILRAQKSPFQNCESLDYLFGDGDILIRQE